MQCIVLWRFETVDFDFDADFDSEFNWIVKTTNNKDFNKRMKDKNIEFFIWKKKRPILWNNHNEKENILQ